MWPMLTAAADWCTSLLPVHRISSRALWRLHNQLASAELTDNA
jgi:hypothetical protein